MYTYLYIYIYIQTHIYIYIYTYILRYTYILAVSQPTVHSPPLNRAASDEARWSFIVAIFYPFSQFCEINISLLSLQTQPNTAPNLFQRGVEYGKYVLCSPERDPQQLIGTVTFTGLCFSGKKLSEFIPPDLFD